MKNTRALVVTAAVTTFFGGILFSMDVHHVWTDPEPAPGQVWVWHDEPQQACFPNYYDVEVMAVACGTVQYRYTDQPWSSGNVMSVAAFKWKHNLVRTTLALEPPQEQ